MAKPDFHLFNTLSGKVEPFEPLEGNRVRMYVCGPTVYDDAHLGHARCYITWDVLYRFLRFLGYEVTYVRNVTDVDDKILNRAKERGVSPAEVAEKNYQSFREDMTALNVLAPSREPKATEFIPQMVLAIEALITKGAAYVTPEGTVYFRVAAKADYGKLSKKPLDDLRAGARVDVDPHKESPLDFALWKHVPAEEQAIPGHAFESPWGKGRPGWHIECSAMSFSELGRQIDIHAGGADLIFPHHENEIAQSEAWLDLSARGHNDVFAKYWLHNGFVNVSGEKMSKSLGNFATIKTILEHYDANVIRYFLLMNGYRMPVDFNADALGAAQNWLNDNCRKTLRKFLTATNITVDAFKNFALDSVNSPKTKEYLEDLRVCIESGHSDYQSYLDFYEGMLNDLNTAKSVAALNIALRQLRILPSQPSTIRNEELSNIPSFELALTTVSTILTLLGFDIDLLFSDKSLESEILPEDKIHEIEQLIQARKQAKSEKNWSKADAIREQLKAEGIQIMDNKDGTTTWELVRK